jgi:hypothetical protein
MLQHRILPGAGNGVLLQNANAMKLIEFVGFAALALAATSVAQAYPILKLADVGKSMTDDNGSIVTVGSVSTFDADADGTGSVGWEGQLGGWTLNSDSGESGPDLDHSGIALDLSFQNYASGPSAFGPSNTMVISWTELFDASYAGPVEAHIGGSLAEGTTVTFSIWEGATQISPTQTFVGIAGSPDSFSSDTTALLFKNADITTLSEVVTLTATEAGTSSGDANVQAPPTVPDSGLTLVLIGFGIGVLVLFSVARPLKV